MAAGESKDKPAAAKAGEAETKTETKADAPPAPTSLTDDVKQHLTLLSRAVELFEPRFTTKVLRTLNATRRKFSPALAAPSSDDVKMEEDEQASKSQENREKKDGASELANALRAPGVYPAESESHDKLLSYLGNPAPSSGAMDVDSAEPPATPKRDGAAQQQQQQQPLANLPEGDVYLSLLVLIYLLDHQKYTEGKQLAQELIDKVVQLNRRTMDQLSSKIYFYWVRLHELNGDDTAALRSTLLAAQRTAALRRDDDLQATLLPLLLRNYISHKLYDQADRLISKAAFPDATAGNAQLARWHYYLGRVRAIQLNYTEAHNNLQQAIRRAPAPTIAPGFLQTAHKLSVIVELLMGEIPERGTFRQPVFKAALAPYFEIVQAVRVGDLNKFNEALAAHGEIFERDGNMGLIVRLRHNVIKAALRSIARAYSRISLADVRAKLGLESEEEAEYIVAKAIRDGVVEAAVDHEHGAMRSRESGDIYATSEPQNAFDTRIRFLLDLHNQSVKAMRFPLDAHSKELASAEEAREREKELAKEIEEAEDEDDLGEDKGPDMDAF